MKNYGINKKKKKEHLLYNIARLNYSILKRITTSPNRKYYYNELYNRHFVSKTPLFHRSCAIPSQKHCTPVYLITSDLVLRDNLPALKKGLIQMLKKDYSHKFIAIGPSIEDVSKHIEEMDDTLTWSYGSINIGIFDFDRYSKLASHISSFDLKINQVNSSYLAIEAHLHFADDFADQIQRIINSDIEQQKTYISHGFRRNNKKSGGKSTYTLCEYDPPSQKADTIYEMLAGLKWLFYNKIQDYFPTVLHSAGYVPPGILLYQTNIEYQNETATNFWSSLGMNNFESQFVNEAEKIFFKMKLSGRYERHTNTDMIYVYHEDKIAIESGIADLKYQMKEKLSWSYARYFFSFSFLEIFNGIYSKKLISFKHELNRIKLKKHCFHKLLKLRFIFERDMDLYLRYITDVDWKRSKKPIEELFKKKKPRSTADYRIITDLPVSSSSIIETRIENLAKEFDTKGGVMQHLIDYKHETRTRRMNFIMFIIAALTLALVIYPEWSTLIADFISDIFEWTKINILNVFANGSNSTIEPPNTRTMPLSITRQRFVTFIKYTKLMWDNMSHCIIRFLSELCK